MYNDIILKWTFTKWDEEHGLDALAQDKDRWRTTVNAVMNLPVP